MSGQGEPDEGPTRTPLQRALFFGAAVIAGAAGFTAVYLLNNPELIKQKTKSKGPLIEVALAEGETLGDLIVKYVGDYTTNNIALVKSMNKARPSHAYAASPLARSTQRMLW